MSSSNSSCISSPATGATTVSADEPKEDSDFASSFKQQPSRSRFELWRPSYHLQAPQGWMNDPCAPGYNPATGLYHVCFQWNPYGNDWGNISWLSFTSHDMLHWTADDMEPALSPSQDYDCNGTFTGCLVHGQDGSMNYIYTSVSSLPIHFTLPHQRGSESLSISTSFDNGKTWTKSPSNPFLSSEPDGIDVTGWRDPYVASWPQMSKALGSAYDEHALYGIVSGGIRGQTPTTFLYFVDSNDLTKWSFIGSLIGSAFDHNISRWSGNMGVNWECTNFVHVKDEKDPDVDRDFLIIGTENCAEIESLSLGPSRPERSQLWASVSVQKDASGVALTNNFSGKLDHGSLYAANSFWDPRSQQQLFWGWIPEDDLDDELRHAQAWSGMLSLPRELRMQTLRNVIGACTSDLSSISSVELESNDHNSYTIRTLATLPCPAVTEKLRSNPGVQIKRLPETILGPISSTAFAADEIQGLQWELDCSFQVSKSCRKVGFHIKHCEDSPRSTTLLFNPQSETVTIYRPSLQDPRSSELINSDPESAPHTLFTSRDPHTGHEETESLDIRVWRDNSVLEVFINSRTAISTRLYAAGTTCGLEFFSVDDWPTDGEREGDEISFTKLDRAILWDKIGTS